MIIQLYMFVFMLWVVVIVLPIRAFLYEPFSIPSASMAPTLNVGDILWADKDVYGYSPYGIPFGYKLWNTKHFSAPPKRGDIVIFALPTNTEIDYIKRVIGLPHDKVQLIKGRLFINDELIERKFIGTEDVVTDDSEIMTVQKYLEILPNGKKYEIYEESDTEPLDNTPAFVVPEGHYFVLGDNRDNSQDTRVLERVGYIPDENLIGKAAILVKDGKTDKLTFRFIETD